MKSIQSEKCKYIIKEKFIIKERSKQLTTWGKYRLWLYENDFYITKKSYKTNNPKKEFILLMIPKYLITDVMSKKHLDSQYLNKIRATIEWYKREEKNNG